MILEILKLVASPVVDYVKGRQEIKKQKAESDQKIAQAKTAATVKRIEQGDQAAINMDAITVQDRGMKDELLLIIIIIPLIMCFVPSWVEYAAAGFNALINVPEWYKWLLLGVYIDTFGFRRILRNVLETYLAKRFN